MFFPFSFGPFLGFWAGFEGAQRLGFRVLAGGGMSSTARLKFLREHGVTVVCATPTYALRLAEVAAEEGIDLKSSGVRAILVAGEPGGSVPAVRGRIEAAWGARVLDHIGMTEVGPTGFECAENPGAGVHVIETEYVAEVLDPATGRPLSDTGADGGVGELVITNLGRLGSPLIRYRTGDLVRPSRAGCPCGRCLLRLEGGLLSRADDMIFVRGNNFYPSALESVLRRFEAVAEYRVEIHPAGPLTRVRIELEPTAACAAGAGADSGAESGGPAELAERVARAVHDALSFRAEVVTVPVGSLPRFEMKAKRFVRRAAPAD
jgi:phenylacetate-CoA ligase